MKKQLIEEFKVGKRKVVASCGITNTMSIHIVDIIHGVDDMVFGYATPNGGETQDFFLVKLKGNSFRYGSVSFNTKEFMRS